MADRKTIRVTMAPGMTMPLPAAIVVDSNVQVLDDKTEVEVLADSRMVRRRLAVGDLVEVVPPAPPAAKPAHKAKAEE